MAPWFSVGTTLPGLGLGLAGLQVGELPLGAEVSACFPLCLNPDPSVLLWHGGCPSPLAASLGLWACGGPWVSAHLMATGSLEVPSLPFSGASVGATLPLPPGWHPGLLRLPSPAPLCLLGKRCRVCGWNHALWLTGRDILLRPECSAGPVGQGSGSKGKGPGGAATHSLNPSFLV